MPRRSTPRDEDASWSTLPSAGAARWPRLLLEAADVGDERVDLLGGQVALEGIHLLLHAALLLLHPVVDGLLELVILLRLELRGGHVSDLHLLTLLGVTLARRAVAGGALGLPRPLDLLVGLRQGRGAEEK